MSITIDVNDLLAIYPNPNSLDNTALQPYVDIGNMVVNEQLVPTACGAAMSTERLEKIAAYVAAHFADVSQSNAGGAPGPIKSEKMGEASETYAVPNQTEAGYNTTRYGQLALALDTCGALLNVARMKATFEVVGDNHIGNTTGVTDVI